MKRKILSLFLCSSILSGAVCGCGHDKTVIQPSDIVITDISAEEWTTEKLCEAVLINGKNISPICTLREFGDEFEIDTNDELYLKMLKTPALLQGQNDLWDKQYAELENWLINIINHPYEKAFRRARIGFQQSYENRMCQWRDWYKKKQRYEHIINRIFRRK